MPDVFDLGMIDDAEPGETLLSDLVTILGIDTPVAIRIEGGEYRVNDGEYTSEPGVVRVGDTVQLRAVAPETYGTTLTVTLSVGGREATFTITTPTELPPITVTAEGGGGAAGPWMLLMLALGALLRRLRRSGGEMLRRASVPVSRYTAPMARHSRRTECVGAGLDEIRSGRVPAEPVYRDPAARSPVPRSGVGEQVASDAGSRLCLRQNRATVRSGLVGSASIAALVFALPAQALDLANVYAGLRVGQALTSADDGEISRNLQDQGYDVDARADEGSIGAELYAGYRVLPSLSAELGYLRAESRDITLSGTAPPTLEPLLAAAAKQAQGMGNVIRLGVATEYRIDSLFAVTGRAAGYRWDSRVTVSTEDMRVQQDDDGFGWTVGLGVRASISPQWSIGLGADYWRSSSALDFVLAGAQLQWDFAQR